MSLEKLHSSDNERSVAPSSATEENCEHQTNFSARKDRQNAEAQSRNEETRNAQDVLDVENLYDEVQTNLRGRMERATNDIHQSEKELASMHFWEKMGGHQRASIDEMKKYLASVQNFSNKLSHEYQEYRGATGSEKKMQQYAFHARLKGLYAVDEQGCPLLGPDGQPKSEIFRLKPDFAMLHQKYENIDKALGYAEQGLQYSQQALEMAAAYAGPPGIAASLIPKYIIELSTGSTTPNDIAWKTIQDITMALGGGKVLGPVLKKLGPVLEPVTKLLGELLEKMMKSNFSKQMVKSAIVEMLEFFSDGAVDELFTLTREYVTAEEMARPSIEDRIKGLITGRIIRKGLKVTGAESGVKGVVDRSRSSRTEQRQQSDEAKDAKDAEDAEDVEDASQKKNVDENLQKTMLSLSESDADRQQRVDAASILLKKQLTSDQQQAILDAHDVPMTGRNEDGTPTYSMSDLKKKMVLLEQAGIARDDADTLLRHGVCGTIPTPPPPPGQPKPSIAPSASIPTPPPPPGQPKASPQSGRSIPQPPPPAGSKPAANITPSSNNMQNATPSMRPPAPQMPSKSIDALCADLTQYTNNNDRDGIAVTTARMRQALNQQAQDILTKHRGMIPAGHPDHDRLAAISAERKRIDAIVTSIVQPTQPTSQTSQILAPVPQATPKKPDPSSSTQNGPQVTPVIIQPAPPPLSQSPAQNPLPQAPSSVVSSIPKGVPVIPVINPSPAPTQQPQDPSKGVQSHPSIHPSSNNESALVRLQRKRAEGQKRITALDAQLVSIKKQQNELRSQITDLEKRHSFLRPKTKEIDALKQKAETLSSQRRTLEKERATLQYAEAIAPFFEEYHELTEHPDQLASWTAKYGNVSPDRAKMTPELQNQLRTFRERGVFSFKAYAHTPDVADGAVGANTLGQRTQNMNSIVISGKEQLNSDYYLRGPYQEFLVKAPTTIRSGVVEQDASRSITLTYVYQAPEYASSVPWSAVTHQKGVHDPRREGLYDGVPYDKNVVQKASHTEKMESILDPKNHMTNSRPSELVISVAMSPEEAIDLEYQFQKDPSMIRPFFLSGMQGLEFTHTPPPYKITDTKNPGILYREYEKIEGTNADPQKPRIEKVL